MKVQAEPPDINAEYCHIHLELQVTDYTIQEPIVWTSEYVPTVLTL